MSNVTVSDLESSTAAPPKPGRRRRFSQLSTKDKVALSLMTAVPFTLHVLLVWVPAISTVLLSFTDWDGFKLNSISWVGLRNYTQIFTVFEKDLYRALINNALLIVFLFLGPTAFGILLAYLLDKELKGGALYQSIFYAPVVLSLAVVGFIWKSVIYSRDQGFVNQVLGRTDGDQIDWIGDQSFLLAFSDNYGITRNFLAILVAIAWTHAGYIMVLYLAGLKSVDPALREAAAIDGCTEWQAFKNVVFPAMKPVNIVVAVITVIQALRAFDIVWALKRPRGTELISILVTNNILGEGGGNVGRGSAYGTVMLVLCIGFIVWYVANTFREDA